MSQSDLFANVMDGGLRDWLSGQSEVRADAILKRNNRIVAGVVFASIAFVAGFALMQEFEAGLFGAVVAFAPFGWWAYAPIIAISADLKAAANTEIARALGLSFQADTVASADFLLAQSLGLVAANPDAQSFSDEWSGALEGTQLHLHEAHLQEWRSSGKHRRLETVFRGVVLGYQFARPFSSTTIVQRDMGIFNAFGALGAKLGGAKWGGELERVRLVDPRLEKAFEIYGSDQVEARYLVHPAFCERLLEMEARFHGKNLRMAFAQGRVVILIESGDQFETGGIDAEGDEARVAETIGQIESLLALSKTLNERPRSSFSVPIVPPEERNAE